MTMDSAFHLWNLNKKLDDTYKQTVIYYHSTPVEGNNPTNKTKNQNTKSSLKQHIDYNISQTTKH